MRWTSEDAAQAARDKLAVKRYIREFVPARIGISDSQYGTMRKSLEFKTAIYYGHENTIKGFIKQSREMRYHSSFYKESEEYFQSVVEIKNRLNYAINYNSVDSQEKIDAGNLPYESNKFIWNLFGDVQYLIHTYTRVKTELKNFKIEENSRTYRRYFPETLSFTHTYLVSEDIKLTPIFLSE